MTLAIYTRPTDGTQDSATVALEVTFLDPAVDMPLTKDSVSSAGARSLFGYLQLFHKWRDPDSNRGHHDFQSFSEAHWYAENPSRYADLCPQSIIRYHPVLSLLLRYR